MRFLLVSEAQFPCARSSFCPTPYRSQVVSSGAVSTGSVSVNMMGTPPANFTARAVILRGGLFVSAFATVLFEVYDAELERRSADIVAALSLRSPSIFEGVSETAVTACSCRDAASTDVAAVPLHPAALRAQPRLCSLHVDGAPAAEVLVSSSALAVGFNFTTPSLAVQVSPLLLPSPAFSCLSPSACIHDSAPPCYCLMRESSRDLKIWTQAPTFCAYFVMVPKLGQLHFGLRPRPSFARSITRAPVSIPITSPFWAALAKIVLSPIAPAPHMPMPTQMLTAGSLLDCMRTCLFLASSGCT